jgi:uncharacterized YccA/Bax inhibitor family protein
VMSVMEKYGPSVFIETPATFCLEGNSAEPMTKRGTANKIMLLGSLSLICMLFFSILIFQNTDHISIKHGLGWFTILPVFPLFYLILRKWKKKERIKFGAIAISILWGMFMGSIFGAFEARVPGIGFQCLALLIGSIIATYLVFEVTGRKGGAVAILVIYLGSIGFSLIGLDAMLSFIFTKYDPITLDRGGPALILSFYMIIMALLGLKLELNAIYTSVDAKYEKASEWYFAYRYITVSYLLLFWIFLAALAIRGKK